MGVCSVSHPDRGGVRALIFPSTRSGGCARCGAKQSRPVTLSEEGAPHRPSGALLRRRYVCTGAHTAPAEWRAASGRQRPRRGGPPAAVWAARGLVAETGGGITARPSPAFRYEAKEIRACVSGCNTDAHVLRAHTAAETGKEKEQIACRVSAAATAENKWNKYSKKKNSDTSSSCAAALTRHPPAGRCGSAAQGQPPAAATLPPTPGRLPRRRREPALLDLNSHPPPPPATD